MIIVLWVVAGILLTLLYLILGVLTTHVMNTTLLRNERQDDYWDGFTTLIWPAVAAVALLFAIGFLAVQAFGAIGKLEKKVTK